MHISPVPMTPVQFFRNLIFLLVSLTLVACGVAGGGVVFGDGAGYAGGRPGGENGTNVDVNQTSNKGDNKAQPKEDDNDQEDDELLPPPEDGGGQCTINASKIEEGCHCLCGGTIWACRAGNNVTVGGACK